MKRAKFCSADKIIASKSTKKGTYFRVWWSNLDKNSDSWEPFENVSMDPILLENFYKNELLKEKRAEIRVRNKMSAKVPPTKGPRASDRISNKKVASISMLKIDDDTMGMSSKNGQNSQICSLTCNNLMWNSIQTI